MKAKEIRDLSVEEVTQRIKDEKEQLAHLEFQHAVAELPNPILIREKRRLLARLKTILSETTRA